MQETVTGAESSEYRSLGKQSWQRFFDAVTNALEGRETEVEVIALGLGDQIEAEWIPLNGLTYDPHADTFYVYLEDVERDLAHAIPSPREVAVRFTGAGLEQVAVKDAEGTLRVIRLRMPMQLELPERVG